jgi:hypothetical protein
MMTDPAGDYSGFLVRVSRDGGVRWARRLGPAQAGLNEAGTGLFSDASEDLTVAGWFMPAEGAQADLFTLVVDRQGQLRARGWRMGGVGNDAGVFALASPDGGAYLFGHSRGSFGNGDYDVWAMATGGDLHVPLRPASGGTTSALDLAFGPLGFELFAVNPCVVTLAPALSSLAPRAESVTVTAAAQAP